MGRASACRPFPEAGTAVAKGLVGRHCCWFSAALWDGEGGWGWSEENVGGLHSSKMQARTKN